MDKKALDEQIIVDLVKQKRKIWKKGSGRNLLKALENDLQKHQIKIGRDKFYEVLRNNGLLMNTKRQRTRTTFSYHHFHKYPNLIRDFIPVRAGELMVSDITYIWIEDVESFAYLFLVTDVYSRKIIGYVLAETLEALHAVKALKKALRQIKETTGCIHHSDRGIQYSELLTQPK